MWKIHKTNTTNIHLKQFHWRNTLKSKTMSVNGKSLCFVELCMGRLRLAAGINSDSNMGFTKKTSIIYPSKSCAGGCLGLHQRIKPLRPRFLVDVIVLIPSEVHRRFFWLKFPLVLAFIRNIVSLWQTRLEQDANALCNSSTKVFDITCSWRYMVIITVVTVADNLRST